MNLCWIKILQEKKEMIIVKRIFAEKIINSITVKDKEPNLPFRAAESFHKRRVD